MTIKEALNQASKALENGREARILLSHHLGLDPLQLILKEHDDLENSDAYFSLINRAQKNEPIEYITQSVNFYSREFFIKKGALIPRPETEILVDKVVQLAQGMHNKPTIAEIGVGSGIISIMIALLLENVKIIASDISQEAIAIAKINAKRFGVQEKITFVHTSYLDKIEEKFDIIVSNPPYIADTAKVESNLSYEPNIALFGGEVGDEILKNIIDLASYHDNSYLCCEMGYDQKEPLTKYLKSKALGKADFYKDLAGFDRGFTLKIGENNRK